MEDTLKIAIYIPVPGSALAGSIDPGSVVVPLGNPRQDGIRAVTWESRGFAERVASTFADRAERAYERSRDHRNDVRKLVKGADLRPLGRLDTVAGTVEIEFEHDAAELAAWLGTATLDPAELSTTRGVVVQMVRESIREHGDQGRPEADRKVAGGGSGKGVGGGLRSAGRSGWHTHPL